MSEGVSRLIESLILRLKMYTEGDFDVLFKISGIQNLEGVVMHLVQRSEKNS